MRETPVHANGFQQDKLVPLKIKEGREVLYMYIDHVPADQGSALDGTAPAVHQFNTDMHIGFLHRRIPSLKSPSFKIRVTNEDY